MTKVGTAGARLATVALAAAAAYLAVVLVLGTGETVANVLEGDRYGLAAFIVFISGAVLTGAGGATWVARRDGHSWWRAARRASAVLILGTYAVATIHLLLAAPFI